MHKLQYEIADTIIKEVIISEKLNIEVPISFHTDKTLIVNYLTECMLKSKRYDKVYITSRHINLLTNYNYNFRTKLSYDEKNVISIVKLANDLDEFKNNIYESKVLFFILEDLSDGNHFRELNSFLETQDTITFKTLDCAVKTKADFDELLNGIKNIKKIFTYLKNILTLQ